MDWLRNLQIRFVSEKNSDVLDISDLGMVSNNEKAKDVLKILFVHFAANLVIGSIIARIILQD